MSKKKEPEQPSGRFSYAGLERLFHEKARLGIVTSLLANSEGLLFSELKEMCSLTDGNLSRHLTLLYEAGVVEIWKGYDHRRPQTFARLSEGGRKEFQSYLEELERVLKDNQAAARDFARSHRQKSAKQSPVPPGWAPA